MVCDFDWISVLSGSDKIKNKVQPENFGNYLPSKFEHNTYIRMVICTEKHLMWNHLKICARLAICVGHKSNEMPLFLATKQM